MGLACFILNKMWFAIILLIWIFSGIFAYLNYLTPKNRKEILNLLVTGLKRLEYRGYDSAGIAVDSSDGKDVILVKRSGKVQALEDAINECMHLLFRVFILLFCAENLTYFCIKLILLRLIWSVQRSKDWCWTRNSCWYCAHSLGNSRCPKRSKFTSATVRYWSCIRCCTQWHHYELQGCKELLRNQGTSFRVRDGHRSNCKACLSSVERASRLFIPWIGRASYTAIGLYFEETLLLWQQKTQFFFFINSVDFIHRKAHLLWHSNPNIFRVNVWPPDVDHHFWSELKPRPD